MADVKISELPNAAPLGSGDAFEITQGGESKQASGSQVSALVTASINPRFNATAGRQGLRFDGVSGFATIPLDATKRPAYGLGDFSVGGWVYVERLGVIQRLFSDQTGNSAAFDSYTGSNNVINWRKDGGTAPTNNYSSGIALKLGWQHILFVRKDGVTKLYYNGVEAYSVADVNSYERPFNRLGARSTGNPLQGAFSDVIDLNYAIPPTTENGIPGVLERYRDGSFLTSFDLIGAKNQLLDSESSTFETGAGVWLGLGATAVSSDEQAFSGANSLKCSITGGGTNNRVYIAGNESLLQAASAVGARIEIFGKIYTTGVNPQFRYDPASGAAQIIDMSGPHNEWRDFHFDLTNGFNTGGTSAIGFRCGPAVDDFVFYLDDVFIKLNGASLALTSESIQPERGQWLDVSANRLHALQAATGTSLIKRLSTGLMVVEGVNATSAVFLFGARNILTDDWTVESVEVFNDGDSSADIDLEFSNGSAHVNLTGATTTIAAGTSKRLQVVNGKPTAYNRIRATGNAGADDMRFILALKPRR